MITRSGIPRSQEDHGRGYTKDRRQWDIWLCVEVWNGKEYSKPSGKARGPIHDGPWYNLDKDRLQIRQPQAIVVIYAVPQSTDVAVLASFRRSRLWSSFADPRHVNPTSELSCYTIPRPGASTTFELSIDFLNPNPPNLHSSSTKPDNSETRTDYTSVGWQRHGFVELVSLEPCSSPFFSLVAA